MHRKLSERQALSAVKEYGSWLFKVSNPPPPDNAAPDEWVNSPPSIMDEYVEFFNILSIPGLQIEGFRHVHHIQLLDDLV